MPIGWAHCRYDAQSEVLVTGSCDGVSFSVAPQFFYLFSDGFVFGDFVFEEADGEAGLCFNTTWGEQVAVSELIVVAPEIVHLDQPLLHQCLQTVVGFAQAHAHRLGHFPLLYGGVGFDEFE
jgi:hypothetical protein